MVFKEICNVKHEITSLDITMANPLAINKLTTHDYHTSPHYLGSDHLRSQYQVTHLLIILLEAQQSILYHFGLYPLT